MLAPPVPVVAVNAPAGFKAVDCKWSPIAIEPLIAPVPSLLSGDCGLGEFVGNTLPNMAVISPPARTPVVFIWPVLILVPLAVTNEDTSLIGFEQGDGLFKHVDR